MPAKPSIPAAEALDLAALIAYTEQGISSRVIAQAGGGNVTLFAFDEGQGLSEHTAPYDASVIITEGEADIKISGASFHLKESDMITMPANEPHSLKATKRFKMILIMIRTKK